MFGIFKLNSDLASFQKCPSNVKGPNCRWLISDDVDLANPAGDCREVHLHCLGCNPCGVADDHFRGLFCPNLHRCLVRCRARWHRYDEQRTEHHLRRMLVPLLCRCGVQRFRVGSCHLGRQRGQSMRSVCRLQHALWIRRRRPRRLPDAAHSLTNAVAHVFADGEHTFMREARCPESAHCHRSKGNCQRPVCHQRTLLDLHRSLQRKTLRLNYPMPLRKYARFHQMHV